MDPSRTVGAHLGPSCRGASAVNSRPDSSQTPSATSTTPMTTVPYGRSRCRAEAADMVSTPNNPNTVKKPSAIPTVAAIARPSGARPRRSPGCCPRTTRSRYAGSMANPQGFSAATKPAAKARPTRPRSTASAQRRHPARQLVLGHGRGGVVDERRAAIRPVEHVGRLPGDVVAGPDRAVGVVEGGEIQVVLGDEVLHCPHIRVRRDADEGDARVGGGHLADAGSLGVAERTPRRPEPQHRRFALQAGAVERRTAERGRGELQAVVGGRGARRVGEPEYQGGGEKSGGQQLERSHKPNKHGITSFAGVMPYRRGGRPSGSSRAQPSAASSPHAGPDSPALQLTALGGQLSTGGA